MTTFFKKKIENTSDKSVITNENEDSQKKPVIKEKSVSKGKNDRLAINNILMDKVKTKNIEDDLSTQISSLDNKISFASNKKGNLMKISKRKHSTRKNSPHDSKKKNSDLQKRSNGKLF